MKIVGAPFTVTDWNAIPPSEHPGESGIARWRTLEVGETRVRLVEYSAGYRADHWCSRGHVILILEGELRVEIQGGPTHSLTKGMSYVVSDDLAPHRSSTVPGAKLFIVD